MTTTIITDFIDGRESQHVDCSCGWKSSSLWAEQFENVVLSWAEQHAGGCGGAVVSRREVAAERVRLAGELDRLDRERQTVVDALTKLEATR